MSVLKLSLSTAAHAYADKENAERMIISERESTREGRMVGRQHHLDLLETTDTADLSYGPEIDEIIFIGRLECERTQLEISEELGIAQSVISRLWQRFQDDGNVSRCYSTGRTELQRRMRTGIWQLLPKKQTEHSIRPVSSALFSYRYDSFKADRVQTLGAHWSICSQACQMCFTYRNSLSPAINLE
ncbi:uncharacterized protein TNCV_2807621 [Trichonephila clavipes]|nr:uncharacterized protein TNCV_2807621 [Trichonephila clavipes]